MTYPVRARTPVRASEQRVIAAVRSVLPAAVQVSASASGGDGFALVIAGTPVQVQWTSDGSLGGVRRLLAHALPGIVVSRSLSPGARDLLSERGVGWVDESGAAEILLGAIVVSRAGDRAKPFAEDARWTPAVLAVAEAVLVGTTPTVSETAAVTGLSSGACTRALQILTAAGLLSASSARGRNSARQIADSERLLSAYRTQALARPAGPSLDLGVLWRDVLGGLEAVGRSWTAAGIEWAVTGPAAAAVIAPHLSTLTSAEVYIDAVSLPDLRNAATSAGLTPIEGGRLRIRPFPTTASRTLATSHGDLMVAPWPRIYVDLVGGGVRGEEAAEHLREVLGG